MGKGVSKLEASPLVSLCKERKKFIKAAKYCRYDLVTAFDMYLQSLLELGNALHQYVEQELVIFDDSSPQVSLSDSDPSEEDSHLEFSSSDSESDLDSLLHHVHDEVEVSTGLHDSPEVLHKSKTSSAENEGHSAANMDTNHVKIKGKRRVKGTSVVQESSNLSFNNPHHSNQENTDIYMAFSREDLGHHEHNQRMSFGSRWETPQRGHWFPQHVDQDYVGAPMSFSHYNDRFLHYGAEAFPMDIPLNNAEFQNHGTEQNNPATALPTPPPPQVSTWDFLYPFSMNYDVNYDADHDVREVREREGIPDLEDETEQSSTVSVFDEKKMERGMRHGSVNDGTSNVAQLNSNEDALPAEDKELKICRKTTEKENKRNSKTFVSKNLEPKTGESVWSEAEETTVQGNKSVGTSSVTTPVASCRMGLKEAVVEIRNEFKSVFDCGKEFSTVIEVGKLSDHPISTKLRAFASCVLGLIIPSVETYLCPSYILYQSTSSRAKLLSNADTRNNQEHVSTTFGDLSFTLEKLYLWEKKLYGEVIGEEKLRILYDKKCRRLKNLDDRGSESDKINHTFASVKRMRSEINVAVASISVISREIDELRDNKLLPELNKLIEGLIGLWKVMSTCHQKQFQAITEAKSHVHILDPENGKQSTSIATLRLEKVILNWGVCFGKFINTEKAFVKHLNDWLLRYILQEPEESESRITPFSPSDIGAPPIFRVCNDWYHAIDKISEIGVSKAISNFASSLHQLYEKLEEEHALKVRVEYLSKDYKHRLQSFCKKNGIINFHHYVSFTNMETSGGIVEAEVPLLSGSDENLATARKRLVEQRARHQQVIRHVNDAASSCLQVGLSPIFEALGSFCSENLKIYEQLKCPSAGPHE